MSKDASIRGGEAMARALRQNGVTAVFSLAGTAHTYFLEAMDRIGGFEIVSTRHETCAVLAADGYARVSGRVGIALIKNDQGLPNAMTGICTANAACSPVVVISSLSPAGSLEAGGEHEGDLAMVAGVAKWSRIVPSAERLAEYVHMAVHQATSGRPGVAVLGVPQEFQNFQITERVVTAHAPVALPGPSSQAIERMADLIAVARRPMILTGGGATASGAGPALLELARSFQLPTLGNSLGRGLVPEDQEIGFSWPLAQVAAKDADLVIAFGLRFTQRLGYGLPPRFSKDAKFIQVDIAAEEIARNRPVDLGIQADARLCAEALLAELTRRHQPAFSTQWVLDAIAPRRARIDELGRDAEAEIHPYAIGRVLESQLPVDAIVAGDGADILNWLHGVYFRQRPRGYMDHYPFGSMGVGTGLALGAGIASREKARQDGRDPPPLVLLTGDGAFGFYCGELHSFERAGLKLIVIIANDGAWGTEHHGQLRALGASYNCLLGKSDYHHIGEAFGFAAQKIERVDEIGPAVQAALTRTGSTILNILTDTDAGRIRKTDPRVQTIAFEDLASSLKTHFTPDVA